MEILVIFLLYYSLSLTLYVFEESRERGNSFGLSVIYCLVAGSIGTLVKIYYSIPKWNWFDNNVKFYFFLHFTDRFKDLDDEVVKYMRTRFKDTKQFKSMCNKYGYK